MTSVRLPFLTRLAACMEDDSVFCMHVRMAQTCGIIRTSSMTEGPLDTDGTSTANCLDPMLALLAAAHGCSVAVRKQLRRPDGMHVGGRSHNSSAQDRAPAHSAFAERGVQLRTDSDQLHVSRCSHLHRHNRPRSESSAQGARTRSLWAPQCQEWNVLAPALPEDGSTPAGRGIQNSTSNPKRWR